MRSLVPLAVLFATAAGASAQQRSAPGPVIQSAGAVFEISDLDFAAPGDFQYKLAFEVSRPAESPEDLNVTLNSVARYLNMHVQAGVSAVPLLSVTRPLMISPEPDIQFLVLQ